MSDKQTALSDKPCQTPPSGWSCTRDWGHEGPCAAIEIEAIYPWGRWHFLRHWLSLSKVDWFETLEPIVLLESRRIMLGRCVECNRIIDSSW